MQLWEVRRNCLAHKLLFTRRKYHVNESFHYSPRDVLPDGCREFVSCDLRPQDGRRVLHVLHLDRFLLFCWFLLAWSRNVMRIKREKFYALTNERFVSRLGPPLLRHVGLVIFLTMNLCDANLQISCQYTNC